MKSRAHPLNFTRDLLAHRQVVPRVSVHLPAWLKQQTGRPRFYFQSREADVEIAAAGALWIAYSPSMLDQALTVLQEEARHRPDTVAPRLLGGRGFDSGSVWARFGDLRFWLPEVEIRRVGTQVYALLYRPGLERCLEAASTARVEVHPPALMTLSHTPDVHQWQANVQRVLTAIDAGNVHKVVLSRCTRVRPAQVLDGLDWTAYWLARNPGSFRFVVEPGLQDSFFGCSPERLFRLSKGHLDTEAMAATAPRGRGPAEDRDLARALARDDKSQRENDWVHRTLIHQPPRGAQRLSTANRDGDVACAGSGPV